MTAVGLTLGEAAGADRKDAAPASFGRWFALPGSKAGRRDLYWIEADRRPPYRSTGRTTGATSDGCRPLSGFGEEEAP